MGRPPSPLKPRKATVNGADRFEVRVPKELRKQEGFTRRTFEREAVAKAYCSRLANDLRNYSDKARGLTDGQKIEAQEQFARLADVPGASLRAAVDFYLAQLAQRTRSVTLRELGERLLTERETVGGRGANAGTLVEIKSVWGRFVDESPPETLASELTPERINDWLMTLTNLKDPLAPIGLQTRRNYRRVLSTVFGWASERVRGWVATNPVAEVKLPAIKRDRVTLLTPEETRRLLLAARPALWPYIALCAFAGLRPRQAARVTWEQIHLDRMEVEVPAGTDKTSGERIVPIAPNLRAWLERTPSEQRAGPIFHSREYFTQAYRAAGWTTWPQDVLRHGYASYRLKIIGSFGRLADEMGNSEKVIRDRYLRSISPTVAAEYFEIYPPT